MEFKRPPVKFKVIGILIISCPPKDFELKKGFRKSNPF